MENESLTADDKPLQTLNNKSKKRFTIMIILALFIILVGGIYWFWPLFPKEATGENEVVVSVKVTKAKRELIVAEASAMGTIFPREQATVSAKINGQIKQMPLLLNKSVKAGSQISLLEAPDLRTQRDEAEAGLAEARLNQQVVDTSTIPETDAQDEKAVRDAGANFENAKTVYQHRLTLYQRGGLPKKELDASQLAMQTAESTLKLAENAQELHKIATNPNNRSIADARTQQAKQHVATLDAQLAYTSVRAPFSGVITEQFQYEGEYVSAGAKLFTIADINEVIVKVPFADTIAAKLHVGGDATVIPQELPDTKLTGHISLVSQATDPTSRSVEVWVNLKNDGQLRANGAAKVVVATQTANNTIVVPTSAVVLTPTNDDTGTVMVVDKNSIAHSREVKLGIRAPELIQIVEGLNEDETVIIEGNYALPEDTKVQPNDETSSPKEDSKENLDIDKSKDKPKEDTPKQK